MLFVVFFPHLIAGPIVRHWEVIPQFAQRALRATRTDLAVGSAFFLMGLYKKVLLADSAAVYANAIYGAAAGGRTLSWFDAWLGTVSYALQIYFDFSGYTDMAIGLARLFSIKFPCNFDSPYQASSIAEFWRRWHMSLTRFLRDYVYIPLGGNRCGKARQVRNILVTFFLSGLWHGAGWTFVVWGLLHGAMLVVQMGWRRLTAAWTSRPAPRAWHYAGLVLTFICVLFTWGLFSCSQFRDGGQRASKYGGPARMDVICRDDQSNAATGAAPADLGNAIRSRCCRNFILYGCALAHRRAAPGRMVFPKYPATPGKLRCRARRISASDAVAFSVEQRVGPGVRNDLLPGHPQLV